MDNGCKKWGDCFTCPFSDCLASYQELTVTKEKLKESASRQREYYWQHREEILKNQRERYKKKRDERDRQTEEFKGLVTMDMCKNFA